MTSFLPPALTVPSFLHVGQTAFVYPLRTSTLYTPPSKSYRNTFVGGNPVPTDPLSMKVRASKPSRADLTVSPLKRHSHRLTQTGNHCVLSPSVKNPNMHHYTAHICPDVLKMSGLLLRSVAFLLVKSINARAPPESAHDCSKRLG